MMNLTKLYVIEKATGEKLYFATETDRAYGYNLMKEYEKITSKLYVINLWEKGKSPSFLWFML